MESAAQKDEGIENLPERAAKSAYLNLTEPAIKQALIDANGDLFIASQILSVTALRLDRAISVSEVLRCTLDQILEQKKSGSAVSERDLHEAIDRRIAIYRVTGLDALHDLAAMPIDENSAQNQVKLAAAARLAGGLEGGTIGGEMGETLKSLNELYQQNAPRIRVVRERMTVEVAPATPETIDVTPQRSE